RSVAGVRATCSAFSRLFFASALHEAACPREPLLARKLLERRFRLERVRLRCERSHAEHFDGRIGAREPCAFAGKMKLEARLDVECDAGVGPAVLAREKIEPPQRRIVSALCLRDECRAFLRHELSGRLARANAAACVRRRQCAPNRRLNSRADAELLLQLGNLETTYGPLIRPGPFAHHGRQRRRAVVSQHDGSRAAYGALGVSALLARRASWDAWHRERGH